MREVLYAPTAPIDKQFPQVDAVICPNKPTYGDTHIGPEVMRLAPGTNGVVFVSSGASSADDDDGHSDVGTIFKTRLDAGDAGGGKSQ